MKRLYLIFCLLFCLDVFSHAQNMKIYEGVDASEQALYNDSLVNQRSNSLALSLYNSLQALDRNYNYELMNKSRKLRMWSNEVRVLGYAFALGILFGCPYLFPDCSLWILIPVECVVACGALVASNILANSLKKKSEAIKESSIASWNINAKSKLCVTNYSTKRTRCLGLGIGFKYSF